MTTAFASKNSALGAGLFYAGSKLKPSELKVNRTDKIKNPLDVDNEYVRDIEIYEVEGLQGKIEMGVEQSDGFYYLWLIDPETGMSIRI